MADEVLPVRIEHVIGPFRPPTFGVGLSGSGKTTLAMQALLQYAPKLTDFILVTNSYDTTENSYLRKFVKRMCARELDVSQLLDTWKSIINNCLFYDRYTSQEVVAQFVARYCDSRPDFQAMMRHTLLCRDTMKETKTLSESALDKVFITAVRTKQMQYIANNFYYDDVAPEDRNTLAACRSSQPFPMIIFDDVTAQYSALKTDRTKIEVAIEVEGIDQMKKMSSADALKLFIRDTLTRSRHYGSIIAFLTHDLSTMDPTDRQLFGPVVLCSESAIGEFQRVRTSTKEARDEIEGMWKKISPDKFERLVYYQDPGTSPNGTHYGRLTLGRQATPTEVGCPNFIYLTRFIEALMASADAPVAEDVEGGRADRLTDLLS
jgi:hypothetical protein